MRVVFFTNLVWRVFGDQSAISDLRGRRRNVFEGLVLNIVVRINKFSYLSEGIFVVTKVSISSDPSLVAFC